MAGKKPPSISLCMIVRDEEERLSRCLESARPFVSEMVVVDTGSSDRTVEIARSFGARVLSFPWGDDFSAARNYSLDQARGDWVLVLDADETLSKKAGRHLEKLTRRPGVLGIYFPLKDMKDDGSHSSHLMLRALRNRPDLRFEYRLHEQIAHVAQDVARRSGFTLACAEGEITHDGYLSEVMEAKRKNDRNLRLYELQLEETPDDLYMRYKFADFLRRLPAHKERARAILMGAYEALTELDEPARRGFSFSGQICALWALTLLDQGSLDEAQDVTDFGVYECVTTPDLHFVRGHVLLRLKQGEGAEESFRTCQSHHRKPHLIPAKPSVTGLGSSLGIARSLALCGRMSNAIDIAWTALGNSPTSDEAVLVWIELETLGGNWPQVTSRLIERVRRHPTCAVTWLKGGELFFRLHLCQKALPWIMRASELLSDPTPALALQGECMLHAGLDEPAAVAFERGLPDVRCRAGLALIALSYGIELQAPLDRADQPLMDDLHRMLENLRQARKSDHVERVETALQDLPMSREVPA